MSDKDPRKSKIIELITENLNVLHHEIINDSKLHSRPGDNTHYRLLVVSKDFEGLSTVKKHQMVYGALKPIFDEGLHSLSLSVFSESEYDGESLSAPSKCFSS